MRVGRAVDVAVGNTMQILPSTPVGHSGSLYVAELLVFDSALSGRNRDGTVALLRRKWSAFFLP